MAIFTTMLVYHRKEMLVLLSVLCIILFTYKELGLIVLLKHVSRIKSKLKLLCKVPLSLPYYPLRTFGFCPFLHSYDFQPRPFSISSYKRF